MALCQPALPELVEMLNAGDDVELIPSCSTRAALVDAEATRMSGAPARVRTDTHTTQANLEPADEGGGQHPNRYDVVATTH